MISSVNKAFVYSIGEKPPFKRRHLFLTLTEEARGTNCGFSNGRSVNAQQSTFCSI